MLDQTWLAQMQEIQKLSQELCRKSVIEQGYVYIDMYAGSMSWGTIRYRFNMSGAQDGQFEFHNLDQAIEMLQKVIARGRQ